jgi:hypothetical protein
VDQHVAEAGSHTDADPVDHHLVALECHPPPKHRNRPVDEDSTLLNEVLAMSPTPESRPGENLLQTLPITERLG